MDTEKPTSELEDALIVTVIADISVTRHNWWFLRCYRYSDPDVNTKPSDIIYTRQGVPNGALFHTDRPDVQVPHFCSSCFNLSSRSNLFNCFYCSANYLELPTFTSLLLNFTGALIILFNNFARDLFNLCLIWLSFEISMHLDNRSCI